MNLFGKYGCGYVVEGEPLELETNQCNNGLDYANFSDIQKSLTLLFRVLTGMFNHISRIPVNCTSPLPTKIL